MSHGGDPGAPCLPATCLPQGTGLLSLGLEQQSILHLLAKMLQGLLQFHLQGGEASQRDFCWAGPLGRPPPATTTTKAGPLPGWSIFLCSPLSSGLDCSCQLFSTRMAPGKATRPGTQSEGVVDTEMSLPKQPCSHNPDFLLVSLFYFLVPPNNFSSFAKMLYKSLSFLSLVT